MSNQFTYQQADRVKSFQKDRVTYDNQIDMGGKKILNCAMPTNPGDVANKAYVDGVAGGPGSVVVDNGTAGSVVVFQNPNTIFDGSGDGSPVTLSNPLHIDAGSVVLRVFRTKYGVCNFLFGCPAVLEVFSNFSPSQIEKFIP